VEGGIPLPDIKASSGPPSAWLTGDGRYNTTFSTLPDALPRGAILAANTSISVLAAMDGG